MSPLLFISIIVTLGTLTNSTERTKTYSVRKISGSPELSGNGDDIRWRSALVLDDFQYPWEKEKTPPTKFRALHNEDWLYCLFDVTDPAVFIRQEKHDKTEVASSSRAEIFFKADDRLDPYYCLEIDPLGRVLDYEATYHRQFNVRWSWPKDQLIIRTRQRSDGYTIEVAISKASLKALGLLKNNTLQAGIFRADCAPQADGDLRFKWISWVKPDSKTPDFHIPSSFGLLRLED
jgi:hypothetical protein